MTGAQVAGLLAIGSLTHMLYSGVERNNVAALAASVAYAKFLGGARGAMKVFTRYFPQSLALTRSLLKPVPETNGFGVWLGNGRDVRWSQFFDPDLADEMASFLKEEGIVSAYDFGCGHNRYASVLKKNNISAIGVDGNISVAEGPVLQANLAESLSIEPRDCVISLEVGAKIKPQYENQFIDNIDLCAQKLAIVSWPIPDQRGPHQINCHHNGYIIGKFRAKGWTYDGPASDRLRKSASPAYPWFQDTIMVFRKEGASAAAQ